MRQGAAALETAARLSTGVIASSSGSATNPCSSLRRSNVLPGSTVPSFFFPPLELRAVDDRADQRRKTVAVGRQPRGDALHLCAVLAFESSAQGIRQHFLGQVAHEELGLGPQ